MGNDDARIRRRRRRLVRTRRHDRNGPDAEARSDLELSRRSPAMRYCGARDGWKQSGASIVPWPSSSPYARTGCLLRRCKRLERNEWPASPSWLLAAGTAARARPLPVAALALIRKRAAITRSLGLPRQTRVSAPPRVSPAIGEERACAASRAGTSSSLNRAPECLQRSCKHSGRGEARRDRELVLPLDGTNGVAAGSGYELRAPRGCAWHP